MENNDTEVNSETNSSEKTTSDPMDIVTDDSYDTSLYSSLVECGAFSDSPSVGSVFISSVQSEIKKKIAPYCRSWIITMLQNTSLSQIIWSCM